MKGKNTSELTEILGNTHVSGFEGYLKDNRESIVEEKQSFYCYIRELLAEKGLKQQTVFLKADIPERYGYKLLSGEKHTRQRDVILRICYAAEFTLRETQCALEEYRMPQLYPKVPRDALLMIIFNERPGDIIEVNELLIQNKMEPLRSSGVQE